MPSDLIAFKPAHHVTKACSGEERTFEVDLVDGAALEGAMEPVLDALIERKGATGRTVR